MIRQTSLDKYVLTYNPVDGYWYGRAPWRDWMKFNSGQEGCSYLRIYDKIYKWDVKAKAYEGLAWYGY